MRLTVTRVDWPMDVPFVIAGRRHDSAETILVELHDPDGPWGRGEAAGVGYLGESAASMMAQLEGAREAIERCRSVADIQAVLPPGGARNALDCAWWDLQRRRTGRRVHELLALPPPAPVRTCFTLSLASPGEMADGARRAGEFGLLKLKLDGGEDLERVRAVRAARPDAELIVDANCAWRPERVSEMAAALFDLGVMMIEQPLPRGIDRALDGYDGPVPLCADESFQHLGDFEGLSPGYALVNIKLDKCGGLTEARAIVAEAKRRGLGLMVGNMCGSSLAMAPGLLVALDCRYVDLDGPLLQSADVDTPLRYSGGIVHPGPPELWG